LELLLHVGDGIGELVDIDHDRLLFRVVGVYLTLEFGHFSLVVLHGDFQSVFVLSEKFFILLDITTIGRFFALQLNKLFMLDFVILSEFPNHLIVFTSDFVLGFSNIGQLSFFSFDLSFDLFQSSL